MSSECGEIVEGMRALLRQLKNDIVDDFLAGFDQAMPARSLQPVELACLRHLPRAAENASGGCIALAEALNSHSGLLHWGQTYIASDFGSDFIDNYGWVEMFGSRGHFANDAMAGGFLLLGPQTTYPGHHHVAEEIYVPLTSGTDWRMGEAPFATRRGGEVIHHASNIIHAMRTAAEPLLALYLWRGGPLAQKSVIDRS